MNIVLTAAVLAAAIVAATVMMKKRSAGSKAPAQGKDQKKPPETAEKRESKPDPQAEYKSVLDVLLKLNILIRKDGELDTSMIELIESIIDDLSSALPMMMEHYPAETLTYEVKRIGNEHLYRTVKEFLDLSVQSRQQQAGIFKGTLESLRDVAARSREIVEKNETREFQTMATFLQTKFGGGSETL